MERCSGKIFSWKVSLFNLYIFAFLINTGVDSGTTAEAGEVYEGSTKETGGRKVPKGGRIREKKTVNGAVEYKRPRKSSQVNFYLIFGFQH